MYEEELAHRRWLKPTPGLRPWQDPLVLDRIGGHDVVARLVDSLFGRFESDPMLRPLFPRDLTNERVRHKTFFAEWLGGSPRYSESAWATLHERHEDLPITRALAERWLGHLHHVLREGVADEASRAAVLERARGVALGLVNHDRGEGASRHRSSAVATCGVGARTLNRAVSLARRGDADQLAVLAQDVPDLIGRPALATRMLQAATLAGREAVVDWLLTREVDVNQPWVLPTDISGPALEGVVFVTPLCAAWLKGRSGLAAMLLGRGAQEDIFTAAFLGNLPLVRDLLATSRSHAQISDPATDVLTITPVHHAVAGKQLPTLRLLLEHTTEPVRTGSRALRSAAEQGNAEMVEVLLAHGADARAVGPGRWVLDPEIAGLLAGAGASAGVGTDGAASGDWIKMSCTGNQGRKDDPAYVTALLQRGARTGQRHRGGSPLHHAVRAGFAHTIRALLDAGADRNALDDRGRTPQNWLEQAGPTVDRAATRRALA